MNFDHIKDPSIKRSLESYKDKIDGKKANPLDVSAYRVEKPWGYEIWLEINEYYTVKIISMKAGSRSSLQSHEKKYETNYVLSGLARVYLEDDNGEMQSKTYIVGEGYSVPIGRKHRIEAIGDYISLECSTTHLDDVIRYADDTNRGSGKIENEHKQS